MKTKEELDALKKELCQLTDEELELVVGGDKIQTMQFFGAFIRYALHHNLMIPQEMGAFSKMSWKKKIAYFNQKFGSTYGGIKLNFDGEPNSYKVGDKTYSHDEIIEYLNTH